jgi:hypothetical protein
MRDAHRGHDIDVRREPSLGGDVLLYYSIFRQSDGYECDSGFTYEDATPREFLATLKERIDKELAEDDPWEERATHERWDALGIHSVGSGKGKRR